MQPMTTVETLTASDADNEHNGKNYTECCEDDCSADAGGRNCDDHARDTMDKVEAKHKRQ